MTVQSLLNRPIVSPANLLRTVEIEKQLYLQTFAAFKDSFGTLVVYRIWLSHKKSPLLSCLQCINVKWFRSPKRESDRVKICQRKIKGKRSRWRVRRWDCSSECTGDPEKKENNGLSGRVLVCASLSSLPLLFALNTGAEIVGANLWRLRWSTANPFNTSIDLFHEPRGLCQQMFRHSRYCRSSSFTLFQDFQSHSTIEYHSSSTFAPLSKKKRTSLFPSDVAIKCNHSSGVYFPFHYP